jgi:hypothetical protein
MRLIRFIILFVVFHCATISQWSTDPHNNLIVGYGLLPELCSDSAGGCYITYEQNTGYPRRLILERLDRYGYKPWGSGKRITGIFPEQSSAKIVEDGYNGVIVSYIDLEITGNPDSIVYRGNLRVQRIDSSGNFLWGTNGVRITLSDSYGYSQAIVPDGSGGCVIAWLEEGYILLVQKIDNYGNRVWGDSGKPVLEQVEETPLLIYDNYSNCVIAGAYSRAQFYRTQKISCEGQFLWGPLGIYIPTGANAFGMDRNSKLYLFGGIYLGYLGGGNIFTANLQKMDSIGNLFWDSLGICIDTINYHLYYKIATSISGTSFLAWDDEKSNIRKVHYQVVSNSGKPTRDCPFLVTANSLQEWAPHILQSGNNSAIVIWRNYDSMTGFVGAQRIDTLGRQLWDTIIL